MWFDPHERGEASYGLLMVLFSFKKRHQNKRKKFFHWFVEYGINSYWDLLFSYRTIRKQTERECFFGNEITFGGVFLFSYSSGKHIQLCETSSIVLALHRIELIFFMVAAGIGLYFGFVIEKVLIRQGCLLSLSSVCTEPKPFLPLRLSYLWVGWGCTRFWRGELTPGDHRDIPNHMASCSNIMLGGKEGKMLRVMLSVCPDPI